jgi:type VI secretion system protein ImpL
VTGWLRSRWALGALALVAFSLVAWFAGDTLALGGSRPLDLPWQRALLIVVVAVVWLGWEVRQGRKARRENERLLDMIAGRGAGQDSVARAAHEVAALRQRFEQAALVLKSARFRGADGERRYVHELPWYVIIGAPGSGKTTALVNSGLRFPLPGAGAEPGIAGVGGTRNCDWWFTEDAVLLDTAGRYTTQQSDAAADAASWLGFLGLLKQFRPRRPLNGALVTLSVSDLVLWSGEERTRYAAHVRERITELHERLGARLPIYLLVTKADLLAGFVEFFGELDAGRRAQVWGVTFDYVPGESAASPGAGFTREFATLERRLYAEMLDRLEQEHDLQRRAAIYRFPQESHGTGALIGQFLDSVFGGAERGALPLRGVYYTSGTQEGSPIDRVLGTLARSFKLDRAAAVANVGTGKSFFLMRLLREVIFPESGLAGCDERLEGRHRLLRMLAYAGIGAAVVLLVVLWSASYFDNQDWVAVARAKTAAAKSELEKLGTWRAGDEAKLLSVLNALRDLPAGYGDTSRGAPVTLGFGLSQWDRLGAQAKRVYRNALRDALLPRLAHSLEDEIRKQLRDSKVQAGLADVLEAYVSLYEARKQDPAALLAALRLWQLPETGGADMAAHLSAALEEGPWGMRHARDEAIIREARQKLASRKTL